MNGYSSQDRAFDWTWFIPELYRFKGLLGLTFIAAILTAILGLAPIVFIQISLDKVLNFGAVSTLYILVMGVCAALIFNGILGYVRDYVINFISTSIEARLAGDIFDKVTAIPASTFQTGSSSEFGRFFMPGVIKNFISTQVLKTIFDATTILVFSCSFRPQPYARSHSNLIFNGPWSHYPLKDGAARSCQDNGTDRFQNADLLRPILRA